MITSDEMGWVGLKQILQRETAFVRREVFRRFGGDLEEWIAGRACDVILNLRDQRRDEVESLVNVGKFIQQFHHSVVVLERMQPDPGQPVLAGDQVFVKRLMLVPQNYDAENGHEREFFKIEGSSLAGDGGYGEITKAKVISSIEFLSLYIL